jgi:hypothetical protein
MSVSAVGVVVWEWLNDGGRWVAYEPLISDYLEGFQVGVVHLGSVDPSYGSAVVDLSAMIQQDRGFAGKLYPCDSTLFRFVKGIDSMKEALFMQFVTMSY